MARCISRWIPSAGKIGEGVCWARERNYMWDAGLINWILLRLQLIYYAIVLHADKPEKDLSSGEMCAICVPRGGSRLQTLVHLKLIYSPNVLPRAQFPLLCSEHNHTPSLTCVHGRGGARPRNRGEYLLMKSSYLWGVAAQEWYLLHNQPSKCRRYHSQLPWYMTPLYGT